MDLKAAAVEAAKAIVPECDLHGGLSPRYTSEIIEKALRRVLTPDDDEQSVTSEWLEEVGKPKWTHDFGGDFSGYKIVLKICGGGVELTIGKRYGGLDGITRGEFRRLSHLLGVTLHGEQRVEGGAG